MIFSNTVARNQNKFNKLKINSNIKLTLPRKRGGLGPDFRRDDGKGRDYEAKNWNDESCLQHDPSRTTH